MTSLVPTIKLKVLPAIPPVDGRPVELQKTDTHIQWRYAAVPGAEATAWVNLVPLVDLIGPEGPSVEMRNNGTFIQWRVTGAPDWINLIAVADLIGPTGLPGADTGRFFRVRLVDVSGASPNTAYEAGDTIDGVTLVAGDYVLRATSGGNALDGVYVVPISGVASRHPAFAAFDDHPASYFTVSVGTAYANTLWRCMSPAGGTLGSTSITIIIAANYSPNNVVVDYRDGTGTNAPLTLSADPGSINNVTVIIEGYGPQPKNAFSLAGLQITPTGGAVWPVGTGNIEFCYGTAIAVNAPGDGTVSTIKVVDDAITYPKMQNISAQYRVLGRNSSGAGDPEEVTVAQLLEWLGSPARGNLLMRGASAFGQLVPGTSGYVLQSAGAGNDLVWAAITTGLPRGFLSGLEIANNGTDATNDIDVAVGKCRDSTDTVDMVLGSALTKRLDAGWAAGTNNGMRNSGASITNTTYHIYLVCKAAGADVDVYAHASTTVATVITALQAETGGASYLYARRIASIVRVSAAIKAFIQTGDEFTWIDAPEDFNASTPGATAVTRALTVPLGLKVQAFGELLIAPSGSALAGHRLSDLATTDAAVGGTAPGYPQVRAAASGVASGQFRVRTNTSAQVRSRNETANADNVRCQTQGYVDTRGRI